MDEIGRKINNNSKIFQHLRTLTRSNQNWRRERHEIIMEAKFDIPSRKECLENNDKL